MQEERAGDGQESRPGDEARDRPHEPAVDVSQDRPPASPPWRGRRVPRDPETRARDHDEIDRLTDDLLPDLIDRLAASGLGEIEVREDDWRIRLRLPARQNQPLRGDGHAGRPADRGADRHAPDRPGERQTDRHAPDRADPGVRSMAAHDAALAHTRPGTSGGADTAPVHRGNGAGPAGTSGPHRMIAISPAVGIFEPRADIRPGTRVRQGDRLGVVDLLGVPQDVVAPDDGVVVDTLAAPGQGVEYGQDLVVIEQSRARHTPDRSPSDPAPVTES